MLHAPSLGMHNPMPARPHAYDGLPMCPGHPVTRFDARDGRKAQEAYTGTYLHRHLLCHLPRRRHAAVCLHLRALGQGAGLEIYIDLVCKYRTTYRLLMQGYVVWIGTLRGSSAAVQQGWTIGHLIQPRLAFTARTITRLSTDSRYQ